MPLREGLAQTISYFDELLKIENIHERLTQS
jgi:hypothetical protein